MGAYLLRRLGQTLLTILGVMVITFVLFRMVAGDIAAARLGQKATEQQKADWRHRFGYDRPELLNYHRQLVIIDHTASDKPPEVDGRTGNALALVPAQEAPNARIGRYVFALSRGTPIGKLTGGKPLVGSPASQAATGPASQAASQPAPFVGMTLSPEAGPKIRVDLAGIATAGDLIDRINSAPGNRDATGGPLVEATISTWSLRDLLNSQFVDHLVKSVTFTGLSLVTNEPLTKIIAERAPRSLSLTVPAMAIGWMLEMVISCFVAYYRGRLVDKLGVFLSVLGMCIPFLAFMIYGQWLMFNIAPTHAFGVFYPANIYVPIAVMVVGGLGGGVRFYRTVILDEVNRDYVRTARAKGCPLTTVLFKHVLKNSMLPILTSLVVSIPFLIMGSLLAESYFGIPGLGDLMLSSINGRDEPIMSGMVFLTAVIYTVAVLITDVCYALFDPRIRLQ